MKLNNFLVKILFVLVIAVLLVLLGIRISNIRNGKTIAIQHQNITALRNNSKQWLNKYNELVLTSNVEITTVREAKNLTDETNKKLIAENKRLGNKLKDTEYILQIISGMDIDTAVNIVYVPINDTIFKEIDSLTIASFKLRRVRFSNTNQSHYTIEYRPELSLSINHYKDGKWRFKNLFHKRQIMYKVDLKSNDTILKPVKLHILKLVK